MPSYRLSQAADGDVQAIAQYTLDNWSALQAERYILGLHTAFERVASNPSLGVSSDDLREGYFRRRYKSHMIFYRIVQDDVLIIRVLHGQMDFVRHL